MLKCGLREMSTALLFGRARLASPLDVTESFLDVMIGQLVRMGYLDPVEVTAAGCCGGGGDACKGC